MRNIGLGILCLSFLLVEVATATEVQSQFPNVDFPQLSTFSEDGFVQMMVEIPAGSVKKYQYDSESRQIMQEIKNGELRFVDYLPYPGNYGFVPSTKLTEVSGGDGDAVDVLLLAESLPIGEVLEVIPLGLLLLQDCGEEDSKVIATPKNKNLQIISSNNFKDFKKDYPSILVSIELWFMNYKKECEGSSGGWADENVSFEFIVEAIDH